MKRLLTRRPGSTIGAGCWWEFTSLRTPGNIFYRSPGLACPVTAILDFRPSGTVGAGTRDVTLILYDPTRRKRSPAGRCTASAGSRFRAPLADYPELGLLLGLMAMMRPENYEQLDGALYA